MASDDRVDIFNVTLGTDTMTNENLPISESEGVAPPIALKEICDPSKEEDMDVIVEKEEVEQHDQLTESASTFNVNLIEIRHS